MNLLMFDGKLVKEFVKELSNICTIYFFDDFNHMVKQHISSQQVLYHHIQNIYDKITVIVLLNMQQLSIIQTHLAKLKNVTYTFGVPCLRICEIKGNHYITTTASEVKRILQQQMDILKPAIHIGCKPKTFLNTIKKTSQENLTDFHNFCSALVSCIPNTYDKCISTNTKCEAVYVEFRSFNNELFTECIIKNCLYKLSECWSHTIICCNDNVDEITAMCRRINPNIKIICLDRINVTYNDYNNLLLSTDFWNLFVGEKILLYQHDSFIFKNNIDEFLTFDFIGSPFPDTSTIVNAPIQVGNGGLSLRTKSIMLNVLNTINATCGNNTYVYNYSYAALNYKHKHMLDQIPEDIFFSQHMQQMQVGSVAPYAIACKFSSDSVFYENTFGMHCMWHGNANWMQYVIQYTSNYTNTYEISLVPSEAQQASVLPETLVNFTRPVGSIHTDFLRKCKTITMDNLSNLVLLVDFNNLGGGTTTFLNFLVSKYKHYNNFLILRNDDIGNSCTVTLNDDYIVFKQISIDTVIHELNRYIHIIDFVFVNHFYKVNDQLVQFIVSLKEHHNIRLYSITHDYLFFNNLVQPKYTDVFNFNLKSYTSMFDILFTQHTNNLNYFKSSNLQLMTMPDYKHRLQVVKCKSNSICPLTIGIIGNINEIKGLFILKNLIQSFSIIHFVIFGYAVNVIADNVTIVSYKTIAELNQHLIAFKPNVLLELTIWPETYSYTLTLAAIIGLPLLIYNKPLDTSVVLARAKELQMEHYMFETNEEFLLLANKHKKYEFYTIEPKIYYSKQLDELFVKNYAYSNMNPINRNNFNKFFIYFPQFHEIPENNVNFYQGFTDVVSLHKLTQSNQYLGETITPNFEYFGLHSLCEYNYKTTPHVVHKQVELVSAMQSGIACYYYWFSENSITNKNMIMKESIDMLFDECDAKNTSLFFIWANENWSKNAAFTTNDNTHRILNVYNEDNVRNNCTNLMTYFTRNCYYKKDNKPVFMIYHSWEISYDNLNMIYDIFNEITMQHGFEGSHIYLNTMNDFNNFDTSKFNRFRTNFDYKTNKGSRYMIDGQAVLDYEKYQDIILKPSLTTSSDKCVQTVAFDFDNHARLFQPDKQRLSTVCIKNYHFLKVQFAKTVHENNQEDIVLINSLNEWGEKMACEPSNELGYYYMNLIQEYL